MKFSQIVSHLRKSPLDAWYYIQGTARIFVFRKPKFQFLIRKHIAEQYLWRRNVAARPCFLNGSCVCCQCDTPDLFFANKECSAGKIPHCIAEGKQRCYPRMMNKKDWQEYKKIFIL